MIDEKLLQIDEVQPPRSALWWNQLTSNQSVCAIIALVMTGALVFQVVTGHQLDTVLLTVISIMVGYYFGENVPSKRGV
ncbi:MAG: hypothetical protein AAF125_09020 [Chloroflexota bacterium]